MQQVPDKHSSARLSLGGECWGGGRGKALQGKRLFGCMMPGQRPNGELREQEASRRLLGSCHNSNKYCGLMCSSLPNEAQTKVCGQRSSLPIRSAPKTSPKCNLCTAAELSMLSAGAERGQSVWRMCVWSWLARRVRFVTTKRSSVKTCFFSLKRQCSINLEIFNAAAKSFREPGGRITSHQLVVLCSS